MAWTTTLITMIRALINDLDTPYTYSNDRLQQLAVIAAVLVLQEVDFSRSYTVSIDDKTISPDPTSVSDSDFQVLVALRTSCMITHDEYRVAAKQAISFKDGPSSMDAKGSADHKAKLASEVCQKYEDAKRQYQRGDGIIGEAIVGPYNLGMTSSGSKFN